MSDDPSTPHPSPSAGDFTWSDVPPGSTVTLGTRSLRALAHPLRVHLMTLLRTQGPATATMLAGRLDINTGSASYHLRQLAAAGLVVEDESRGNARDRWWRTAHRSTYFEPGRVEEADRAAGALYLEAIAGEYAERLRHAARTTLDLPAAWRDAMTLSDWRLRLSPDEAGALVRDLVAVIKTYRRDDDPGADAPADAESVVLQVQAMVDLGAAATRRPEHASGRDAEDRP